MKRTIVSGALLPALLAFAGSASALDVVHRIGFTKTCPSTTTIGDPYQCSYVVENNLDEAHDTLTLTGLVDVVHSAGGDMSSGNAFSFIAIDKLHDGERGVHAVERELHGAVGYGNARESVDQRVELHVAVRLDAQLPFILALHRAGG